MTDAAEDDALERLRHDLGKAIVLQVTWLGPDPEPADLRRALAADLLETRRSPSGTVAATQVWAALRPALATYEGDPDRAGLEAAMAEVAEVAALLEAGSATDPDVVRGARAARTVADRCRSLHRRHRHG